LDAKVVDPTQPDHVLAAHQQEEMLQQEDDHQFVFTISYCEIYNEEIRDLLDENSHPKYDVLGEKPGDDAGRGTDLN
jgi:hypothetical protein